MAIINFEQVWQNFLTLGVLLVVFYWVYKSMRETKFKQAIRDGLEKIKYKRE